MKWTEVKIHTTNEAIEPISNLLDEADVGGIVIEDPEELKKERDSVFGEIYELDPANYPKSGVFIKFYLPKNDSIDKKVSEIKQMISNLRSYDIDIGENKISMINIDEEDWATSWKKYYKPTKVSDNITIVPTWEEYEANSKQEIIIELDPGMAFGTGTHPTTMLCVQALENHLKQDDLVIDVGCGSGILSIAAGLLGANSVYAFDLDEIAVKSTKDNVALNNLSKVIDAKQNNLLQDVKMKADIIVSNILAEIIVQFTIDAWNNLKPEGIFITSGIIKQKEQLVLDSLIDTGFEIIEVVEMKDWISIIAKKI